MSVILKQFDGGAIAPRDDAILYNSIITRNGILNGCTITHLGANQIKITAGRGIIKGRMFEVEEMTVNCQLASAGTQKGRMYLRMELSNMENPAQIKTVAADTLPELVQEEDCNYTNGIYELELCTYDVTDTLLSNLKTTYEVIDTVFPVAKTLDDVNGVTDEDVLAGALAVKELSSDLGGCRFGYTADGLPGYKKEGADTVYPFLSTYEALIPVLTSPSENVIASDNNASYPPWYAFTDTGRYIADATSDAYLGYAFSKPVIVKGVVFMGDTNYPGFCSTAELQASDDGSVWHTVSIVNGGAKTLSKPEYVFFQESESHKFWRVKNTGAAYRMGVYTMQFLGIIT